MPPLHPATVHFPITFLISASALDLLTHATQSYPTSIAPLSTFLSISTRSLIQHLTLFSYLLTIAGLLTSIPAVLTGGQQALGIISNRGLKAPASKVVLAHAALMDASVAGSAWNWWSRRGAEGYMSAQANGVVSALVVGLVLYSASLGGDLVYQHGTGVQKAGQGKKVGGAKKDL